VCSFVNNYSTDAKEVYNTGECVKLFCDTVDRFIDETNSYNFA